MPIRVVLVDDHPIVLQGLQRLFEQHSDFSVLACCSDADAALDAVRTHRPDVLVLDLRMPGGTGLDVLRTLSTEQISCKSILLTAAIRDTETMDAMKLGVMGIVLKESSPEVLLDCVRRVQAGDKWIERETATRAVETLLGRESRPLEQGRGLTPRERDVVQMVARGLRNKTIAERLSISEGTVKVHLHNIYEKLEVDGRLELVLCAQQKGII
jgi:DNA-binding NarL/FixJ family response regulator